MFFERSAVTTLLLYLSLSPEDSVIYYLSLVIGRGESLFDKFFDYSLTLYHAPFFTSSHSTIDMSDLLHGTTMLHNSSQEAEKHCRAPLSQCASPVNSGDSWLFSVGYISSNKFINSVLLMTYFISFGVSN